MQARKAGGRSRKPQANAEHMVRLIPEGIEALAGLEMGGNRVVTLLSQLSGIPAVFVRKKAKEYGTCKLAEGGNISGKKLLIIEDVVTSGGQILRSAFDLRECKAIVEHVVCVIDREAGGSANLAKENLSFRSLFTMSELKEKYKG